MCIDQRQSDRLTKPVLAKFFSPTGSLVFVFSKVFLILAIK
jgi:hypothetical protein